MVLERKELGEPGVSFLTKRLSEGGALSRAVLSRKGPIRSTFSALPPDWVPRGPEPFEYAISASPKLAREWLADILEPIARTSTNPWLLIDDFWGTDANFRRHPMPHPNILRPTEDGVVHAMAATHSTPDAVKELIGQTMSFHIGGILADFGQYQVGIDDKFAAGDLADLAKLVFVSAFDQEGFVVSMLD